MEEAEKIPHMGQITVNAIVYKQKPDGSYSPEAIWHDSFPINVVGNTGPECIENIKAKIERIKDATN